MNKHNCKYKYQLKPFQILVVAGPEVEVALHLLQFLSEMKDAEGDFLMPLEERANKWQLFALDLVEAMQEPVLPFDAEDVVEDFIERIRQWNDDHNIFPPFCDLQWHDGELIVAPQPDWTINSIAQSQRADELPEVPDPKREDDFFLVISDHGNLSLYEYDWVRLDWQEVWAVV